MPDRVLNKWSSGRIVPDSTLKQRDAPDVRVGDRLEHQRQRICRCIGRNVDGRVARGHGDGRTITRRGADLADEVGETVDGDVGGGGTDRHREDRRFGDALGQRVLELLERDRLAAEVALELLVVGHHDAFDEVVVYLVLEFGEIVGHVAVRDLAAVVEVRRVAEEIGDAVERGLLADRQLERCDAGAELLAQLVERALEARALSVELVDEDHARHVERCRELPRRLCLHFDAFDPRSRRRPRGRRRAMPHARRR